MSLEKLQENQPNAINIDKVEKFYKYHEDRLRSILDDVVTLNFEAIQGVPTTKNRDNLDDHVMYEAIVSARFVRRLNDPRTTSTILNLGATREKRGRPKSVMRPYWEKVFMVVTDELAFQEDSSQGEFSLSKDGFVRVNGRFISGREFLPQRSERHDEDTIGQAYIGAGHALIQIGRTYTHIARTLIDRNSSMYSNKQDALIIHRADELQDHLMHEQTMLTKIGDEGSVPEGLGHIQLLLPKIYEGESY